VAETKKHDIPYPAFAMVAGPFLGHAARRLGLGSIEAALVVGVGVAAIAGLLTLVPKRQTQHIVGIIVAAARAAAAASLVVSAMS
jgi:hypothetical protein